MTNKTVLLTIERTKGIKSIPHTSVIIPEETTAKKTCKAAELKWLNEYINRDGHIKKYTSLTGAKQAACVTIKSRIE